MPYISRVDPTGSFSGRGKKEAVRKKLVFMQGIV
jgi:hypothetical protein